MPLIEYHCLECGEDFEKIVRFSELDPSPECPACHSTHTQKQISIFAAVGANISSRTADLATPGSCSPSTNRFR